MLKNYTHLKEYMDPVYVKSIPNESLADFCEELRCELISIISVTGGHIGVNLGVIELTVALYRVFDFPKDKLVWDIGHQIYTQKMLTNRLPLLRQIRKNGGSPGYAFKPESHYESVTSSHAGAALSIALGAAKAMEFRKNYGNIGIAVVGDGSFVQGSNQEALNHLAVESARILCIINDNEIALDRNFGGWHEHFKKITRDASSSDVLQGLGINYRGPVDGHDISSLVETLSEIRDSIKGPQILHLKTVKGKGLERLADASPVRIHWNFPFDLTTFANTEGPKSRSHASVFCEALDACMHDDPDIFVVTPATLQNTGIFSLSKKYPERVLDVGMAEQHSVSFSAGLSLGGLKPVVCFEATFLQLVYDQVIHDLCISDFPVMIVAARSGHTGLDHITHHSLLDLSYLRVVPNLRVIYPASQVDLSLCFNAELRNLRGPVLLLFPYGGVIDDPTDPCFIDRELSNFQSNSDILLLTVGMQNKNGQDVQRKIKQSHNILIDHVCITEVSSLSSQLLEIMSNYKLIVTMEENVLLGGIGSAVLEATNSLGLIDTRVRRFGFPKSFIEHGTREFIYKRYDLDADSIVSALLNELR